jgi:hypothetical protein
MPPRELDPPRTRTYNDPVGWEEQCNFATRGMGLSFSSFDCGGRRERRYGIAGRPSSSSIRFPENLSSEWMKGIVRGYFGYSVSSYP